MTTSEDRQTRGKWVARLALVAALGLGLAMVLVLSMTAQVLEPIPLWEELDTGRPVCTERYTQTMPSLVHDGGGGAIIAWEDRRDPLQSEIFVQRVDMVGNIRWVPTQGVTVCVVAGDQLNPQIVSDRQGGALIGWEGNTNIYARHADSTGLVRWGDLSGIDVCEAGGTQRGLKMAPTAWSGAYLVWEDSRPGSWGWDIYAHRVLSESTLIWPSDGISVTAAARNQTNPQIMSEDGTEVILVWEDTRFDWDRDIFASKLNYDAQPQWIAAAPSPTRTWGITICDESHRQRYPQLVSDGDKGAIVVWQDDRNGDWDIYGQWVDKGGTLHWLGTNGTVIYQGPGDQINPRLVSNGAGGATVFWQDFRKGDGNPDIYARTIKSNGDLDPRDPPVGTGPNIICSANYTQESPSVLPDGAGGAYLVWEDHRNGGNTLANPDIYAQHVDVNRTRKWTPANGIIICNAPHTQTNLYLGSDGWEGAIVAWQDIRGDNYDIYAQRLGILRSFLPTIQRNFTETVVTTTAFTQ